MPFTDDFVSAQSLGNEFLAPLDIYWCVDCKIVQTLHDVEVADYYMKYRYTVSNSAFAQHFMQQLASASFFSFGLRAGDTVIEIGSSDGYQLSCFQQLGARVLGFEPSAELTRFSQAVGVPVIQRLFCADTIDEIPQEMIPAQLVILTYTFDHLPGPIQFLEAVHNVLDPNRGVLLIEVHDLSKIIERRETCLFEHEHTIYLNALSMKRLLDRTGFDLLTTELVSEKERRGNSLLVAAAPRGCQYHSGVNLTNLKTLSTMDEWSTYITFSEVVRQSYSNLREYVYSRVKKGLRFAGYGAGGRGVMTLAMADFCRDDIAYLCDRNPSFHGLYTPRTHIPIVSPEQLLADPVDEVIIFSFGYLDEIKQQLAGYVKHVGRLVSLLDLL
jgi:hypothetical protein